MNDKIKQRREGPSPDHEAGMLDRESVRRKLLELFGKIDHEVPLILFADRAVNRLYNEVLRTVPRRAPSVKGKRELRWGGGRAVQFFVFCMVFPSSRSTVITFRIQ